MLRPKRSVLEEFDESEFEEELNRISEFDMSRCNCRRNSCGCEFETEEMNEVDEFEIDFNDFDCCHHKPKPQPCPPRPCPPRPCPPRPCPPRPCPPRPCPDPEPEEPNCAGQVVAMAYVKKQNFNQRNVYHCDKALRQGTMFSELDKPFKGGACRDE